jgi:1-piperideine-2-carboxylate/1-pyrroline-2-carboxylate reductase [NAD(P)H]
MGVSLSISPETLAAVYSQAMSFASSTPATGALDAAATAQQLPWSALADEIALLLRDGTVSVPARSVLPLAQGGSLFLMPATDRSVAMTKLITFTPANAGTGRPSIQGDVVVFDIATGARQLVLDGPTVTARRTAAVSLLAARHLAQAPQGPLLIVGAGVQGLAHAEAFVQGLGVNEVWISSRSMASAETLATQVRAMGAQVRVVADADAALAHCPLVAACTTANSLVLHATPRPDAFITAVGAFTPAMAELAPALCRHVAEHGSIVVDTADACHEAGDLLQAGLDVAALPALRDVVCGAWAPRTPAGPVLFKSCGWAGWDLAAARLALRQGAKHPPAT